MASRSFISSFKGRGLSGLLALTLIALPLVCIAWSQGRWALQRMGSGNTDLLDVLGQAAALGEHDNRNAIVLLSDSTTVSRMPENTLADKLQSKFTGLRIQTLWHPRLHMPHFYILARHLMPSRPKAVIVTINPASMSPAWYSSDAQGHFALLSAFLPLSELWQDRESYCDYFGEKFSMLLAYRLAYRTHALPLLLSWRGLRYHVRTRLKDYAESIAGRKPHPRMVLADNVSAAFLNTFSPRRDDSSLHFARKIRDLGKRYGVPVLFYVSPVDHEGMQESHIAAFRNNIKRLNEILSLDGLAFINLWDQLPHRHFVRENGATDPIHYDHQGASLLAEKLYQHWGKSVMNNDLRV